MNLELRQMGQMKVSADVGQTALGGDPTSLIGWTMKLNYFKTHLKGST